MRALGRLLCAAAAWAARVVDVAVDGDGAMQTDDGPLSSWAQPGRVLPASTFPRPILPLTDIGTGTPRCSATKRERWLPKFEGDEGTALRSEPTSTPRSVVSIPEDARDGAISLVQRWSRSRSALNWHCCHG